MPANTPNRALSYPQGGDNVSAYPSLAQTLANALDFDMKYTSGLAANIPAAGSVPTGTGYLATDTNAFSVNTGSAWVLVNPPGTRSGLAANIPAAGSVPTGTGYLATDTNAFSVNTGSAWVLVNPPFGGSAQLAIAAPCRVYRNAVYNHGGGGYQTMAFDTVTFDPGSRFSSNVYNCPAAGYYQVNGQIRWSSSLSGLTLGALAIYKNGVIDAEGTVVLTTSGLIDTTGWTVNSIVQCAVNDTLNLFVYSNVALTASASNATNNYMSVVRVA